MTRNESQANAALTLAYGNYKDEQAKWLQVLAAPSKPRAAVRKVSTFKRILHTLFN